MLPQRSKAGKAGEPCFTPTNFPNLFNVVILWRLDINRVFLVQLPFYGIVDDIFTSAGQFIFISDNPFVIISLPHRTTRVVAKFIDLAR